MTTILHRKWAEFKQGRPGRRFQDRYEHKRHIRQGRHWAKSALEILLAVLFILIGIVLVFIPGPAVLFFALAAVLLADLSRWMARLLDWTELKIRKILAWVRALWKRSSLPVRSIVVLLGMLGGALAGYCGYQLLIPD